MNKKKKQLKGHFTLQETNIEANDNKLRQQALKTLYIQATFRFK